MVKKKDLIHLMFIQSFTIPSRRLDVLTSRCVWTPIQSRQKKREKITKVYTFSPPFEVGRAPLRGAIYRIFILFLFYIYIYIYIYILFIIYRFVFGRIRVNEKR
jgi:hypothetical protein